MAEGPVVFVDRDGTLIADRRYLSDPAGVALLPGVVEGLRRLAALSARVVAVTNQSGIGRGYFPAAAAQAVNAEVDRRLAAHGLALEGWYVCPHAPDAGCGCRKPRPGLVGQACRDRPGLRPDGCFVIGDKAGDIRLALAVGGTGILCRPGAERGTSRTGRTIRVPDFAAAASAVTWLWRGGDPVGMEAPA